MRRRLFAATVATFLVFAAAPAFASHISGPMIVGDAITEEFGLEEDAVHDLHEQGIGYGAIFLLQLYAAALETDVESLLSGFEIDPETGEYEFNFGELFDSLTEEQRALLETLPSNLGELVSEGARPDHAGEGKPDWAGEGKPDWAGQGKPPFAGPGDDEDEDDGDA